jgi:large subunit ribosomal protein L10
MSKKAIALKAERVKGIQEKVARAKSVVITDYRGLTVEEDTALRVELRKAGVEYKVLKNSLVLRALNGAGYPGFDEVLKGPTAVAISYDDPIAPAKILVGAMTKYNKTAVKGGIVETRKADAEQIKEFAQIPAKPVLVGQLLGMLTHPMRSLAVVLSEAAKKRG